MIKSKFGGTAAALALLSMAAPAQAQDRHGRRDHDRRHHPVKHDKIDGGGFVLGALLVGGIALLAHSEKKRREKQEIFQADYETDAEGMPIEGSSPVPDVPAPYASEYDGLYDPPAAQERCAAAAEAHGQNYARLARVTSAGDYTWNGKSWVVKGKIELADGHADPAPRKLKWRCALRAGQEPVIGIAGLAVAP